MYIGNIVSEELINVGNEFNIVKSLDDINDELPTLIVGYSTTKNIFNIELDFIDRKIDGYFWTFNKKEFKKHYIVDINNFITYCYEVLVKNITYIFVDPIQYSNKKMLKIIKKILSLKNIITFISENEMVYIFGENIIFGVDLNLLRFVGLDSDKIKNKIKSISKTTLCGNETLIEYNDKLERLNNQNKFIPILYLTLNGNIKINQL